MSDKINVMTFEDALENAKKKHVDNGGSPTDQTEQYLDLLLGNGYTLALDPEFNYHIDPNSPPDSLPKVNSLIQKYKDEYGFNPSREDILRSLHRASWTCEVLSLTAEKKKDVLENAVKAIDTAIKEVRKEFLKSIADENNVNLYPQVVNQTSLEFIKKFDHVFTTNYDLALYWDLLISGEIKSRCDGFAEQIPESPSEIGWVDNPKTDIHYLHGALHLHAANSDKSEVRKFIRNKNHPVVSSIKTMIDDDKEPLFVTAGTPQEKELQIKESKYLARQLEYFKNQVNDPKRSLFIYGSSISSGDKHLWNLIEKGRIRDLYISTYLSSDPDKKREELWRDTMIIHHFQENRKYYSRSDLNPLEINFFDASKTNVWKNR